MYREITNDDRAAWAEEAIAAFMSVCRTDLEDATADLLCNMMHMCRLFPNTYGSFEANMRRAVFNFEAEVEEEIEADAS